MTKKKHPDLVKIWGEADRGQDGLKRVMWQYFKAIPALSAETYLTEPTILTADGIEKCVVMSIEDYFSVMKSNPKGKMIRVQGVLYREMI